MALVLRPSRIHAAGVFTTTPVRKGTRIVEYAGPRITPEEADRLYDGAPRTYLYGLEDGKTIIDGEGLGAYLNHSCDPNCEIDEIKGRAWIFALRDIAAGEELLWDYNLYDDDAAAPCQCGSSSPSTSLRKGSRPAGGNAGLQRDAFVVVQRNVRFSRLRICAPFATANARPGRASDD